MQNNSSNVLASNLKCRILPRQWQTCVDKNSFQSLSSPSQISSADTICRQRRLAQFAASANSSGSLLPSLPFLRGRKRKIDTKGPQPFLLDPKLAPCLLSILRRQNASQGMTSDKIMLQLRVACVTGEAIYDEDPLCPE